MSGIVVPVSRNESQTKRLVDGIIDFPQIGTDTRITIVNVFEEFDPDEQFMTKGIDIDSEALFEEEQVPETVTMATETLTEAGYTVDIRREHGDITESILDCVADIDADGIAMTGRQRSPVGKVLLGSVTQSILLSAECPVIVIPKSNE